MPVVLAWPLERAQQRLQELARPVHVCDITPPRADERYSELRVVRQAADEDGAIHLAVARFIPRCAIQIVQCELDDAPKAGVYAVELTLPEPASLSPGALGQIQLQSGLYVYVGSARKGLPSRLARHATEDKNSRWHIDHLTAITPARRALVWPWTEGRECLLASELTALGQVVTGFGAGDCQCRGHLFRLDSADEQWWRRLSDLSPPLRIIAPLPGRLA